MATPTAMIPAHAILCPFCHGLIVHPPEPVNLLEPMGWQIRATVLDREQRTRDHIRLVHPRVWPMVQRVVEQIIAEAPAKRGT